MGKCKQQETTRTGLISSRHLRNNKDSMGKRGPADPGRGRGSEVKVRSGVVVQASTGPAIERCPSGLTLSSSRREPALPSTLTTNTRCRIPITGTACGAQIPTRMRTLYKIQLQIHLLYPLLVFVIISRCHLLRLPYGLHRVKDLAPVSIQLLTMYTTVSRHVSHLSMVAQHTSSHAQPQYFNSNGFHSPSPNPPPYTEYAELNCPQSLRHREGESSYWTAIAGDSSRHLEGQSNR